MSFNLEEFEIELWERALKGAEKEEKKLKDNLKNDPVGVQIDCHVQFNELLKTHQGKERHTPEFGKKIKELADREAKAKRLQKRGYSLVNASDKYSDARIKTGYIMTKLNNLKFYYSRRNK